MSTRRPKWVIKQTADQQFMVLLKGGNGEPLVWSESYTRRADAVRAWHGIVRATVEALMPKKLAR